MGINGIDTMGLWGWDGGWVEATLTVVPIVGWVVNPKFQLEYYSNLPERALDASKSLSLGIVNTAASTITFGSVDRIDPFNWLDKQTVLEGYYPARIGSEAVLTIATFGYTTTAKVGWVPKAVLAWSTADNVIGAGKATYDISQNGFSWENSIQLTVSLLGVYGNAHAFASMKGKFKNPESSSGRIHNFGNFF